MGRILLCVLDLLVVSSFCCGITQEHKPVLTVSPLWLRPGASVTLSCRVERPSAGWRFYWYRAVPDLSHKNYSYVLLPDSISGTVQDSYVLHGQTHTAGYACRADGRNPDYSTGYSEPKFVWSAGPDPTASLTVTPAKEQHFISESVSINCEGDSPPWIVKEFVTLNNRSKLSDCSTWRTMSGSSCTFNIYSSYRAVCWCESGSGAFSNAVNITGHNRDLFLVSPVHPVTEGSSVTLTCRLRGQNTVSNVIFYHNDKLIQNNSREELNISKVSHSDEGFYKCEYSGKVSPQSWMAVQAVSRPESSTFPVLLVIRSVIGVGVIIILLFLLCRCIKSEASQDNNQQQIYSSLLHGQREDPEEIPEYDDVTSE
ncbi:hypothetical protein ATANTOWER_008104 [Ataeniobius toweri]|uniref:Ig-like domain-containing protein n=1 Tax=Ataeniobius toweri TaxID=208326 RepID=A0ABU7AQ42_9TELE|nr:hypothetical protein [Ataeniobius toweri]